MPGGDSGFLVALYFMCPSLLGRRATATLQQKKHVSRDTCYGLNPGPPITHMEALAPGTSAVPVLGEGSSKRSWKQNETINEH